VIAARVKSVRQKIARWASPGTTNASPSGNTSAAARTLTAARSSSELAADEQRRRLDAGEELPEIGTVGLELQRELLGVRRGEVVEQPCGRRLRLGLGELLHRGRGAVGAGECGALVPPVIRLTGRADRPDADNCGDAGAVGGGDAERNVHALRVADDRSRLDRKRIE